MESWEGFRNAHPDGLVMDEPDWRRTHGRNPCVGYGGARRPLLYSGEGRRTESRHSLAWCASAIAPGHSRGRLRRGASTRRA